MTISSQREFNNKLRLSVVVPAHNEAGNLHNLINEICIALSKIDGNSEIIFVDDGSSDNSIELLLSIQANCPKLRVLAHKKCFGQSASIITGVKAAESNLIVTLDGDGQNDPADIPILYGAFRDAKDPNKILIAGFRARRQDTWIKRVTSKVANKVRSSLLSDNTPDTGCGLKLFTRTAFLDMPHFNHMHRFLPALMIRQGGKVVSLKVRHRPRKSGKSNYGTLDRLAAGFIDLFGVLWLQSRTIHHTVEELDHKEKESKVR
ncbi:MAG: dolichol-phosphate mannosyltransferase [Magnetovibrio sp.]|nr:dolichol-phosphate mannosyltransferase [Magnetovibrio sp.]|tara:strand:+ start:356 stop:1141 length:786 start_codon:yes stop_codon:yes gene_type:complete